MSEVKYLLDENVDPLYRTELLRREPAITVWRVGMPHTPPDQTPDPEILRWCEVARLCVGHQQSQVHASPSACPP